MFTFVLPILNSVLNAVSVLTPSVVCFILWAIQTPNRPPTPYVLIDSEKICGMGEVYLTISRHKTRTDVRTKLNFPFCAFKIMQLLLWNVWLRNKKWFCCRCQSGRREVGSVALSFVVVSHSASLRSIKRQFLFVCKGFISLIYILIFNFPSMVVIIYIIYIIYYI